MKNRGMDGDDWWMHGLPFIPVSWSVLISYLKSYGVIKLDTRSRFLRQSRRATTWVWIVYTFLWILLLVSGSYIGWRNDHVYAGLLTGVGILVVCLVYAFLISPWHVIHKLPQPGPEYTSTVRHIEGLIEPICKAAQVEIPRIFIVQTQVCNAFAAGVFGRTKAIGITVGALQLLTDKEVVAVLAHEVAHIKRKDNLFTGFWIAFIGLTMTAAIVLFAIGAALAPSSDRRGRKEDGGAGFVGLAAMVLALVGGSVSIILMHVAMRSDMRRREYLADHDAAVWTGTPLVLAAALEKMEAQITALFARQTATAYAFSMRAVQRNGLIGWLFDTHPSTGKRIKRLQKMANSLQQDLTLSGGNSLPL